MTDYTKETYEPYIRQGHNLKGLLPLPNAEDVDPLAFLNNLASGGHSMIPVWGYTKLPDGSRAQWSQCFLTNSSNMGSGPDGGGYVVTYGGGRYEPGKDGEPGRHIETPIVRRFQICKHEKESTGTLEQERRGYHPGRCKKCGLDMTIDSGD